MSGTFNINQINVNVTDVIPPDNFATVDAGAKIGTVYTKEQDNAWRKEVEENTTSGIKGIAKPDDTVPTTGFFRMIANTADTYTNYLDDNDAPIVVTADDLNIVNGVQRNEVIIEVTNGVAEKKVFAKVGADGANGTTMIPQWVAGDYSPDAMVLKDLVQYIAPNGASSTDVPSGDSNVWKSIGGKVSNTFIETNDTEAASMNAVAKYITDRFGVDVSDAGAPPVVLNQSNAAANNQYLTPTNTVQVDGSANNSYVIHNYLLNGVHKAVANGYILKDSSAGRVGILGIRSNGIIDNLTAGLPDYQLVVNLELDLSLYEKVSINMAGGFEVKLEFPSTVIPLMSEYFQTKEGFSEIFERVPNRYITTYQGATSTQIDWECSEYIRVEAGDVLYAEGYGWSSGMAMYAVFDKNKKWIRSGAAAPSNGALVKTTFVADTQGYVVFCSRTLNGPLRVWINKTSKNKIEELNNKLPFIDNKKLDYKTPTSFSTAKFFEPYIDGDMLKVKLPTTVKDKIVLNDEHFIMEDRFVGEHSFVFFKGRILVYYTEAFKTGQNAFDVIGTLSVGMLDEETGKHTYLQKVIYGGLSDVPAGYNVHRSHAFVNNNQVYIVATVENSTSSISEVWMFKSSDGFNFVKVKTISSSNTSGVNYKRFGNLWLVTEQIDGYYYFFYEGLDVGSQVWTIKIARSATLEGDYSFYQNVTGVGQGGATGGICVIFHNNKFRMWYHYSPSAGVNLPTYLGYAESPKSTPGSFTFIHQPFLALDNSPIGPGTDQNGDFALLEINGSIWAGYQYAINEPILNGIFCWKKLNGLTYDKLFD